MKTMMFASGLLCLLSSCDIAAFFQQKYYQDAYMPQEIREVTTEVPETAYVDDVHCYSYQNAYCQSASLQMIMSQLGSEEDIHYYNWMMGFTYGAYYNEYAGIYSFLPANDPEPGFVQAAQHLGLKREYLTTNNRSLYLHKVKAVLAEGIPVRVAINSATLAGKSGFFPHSVLLIGYSADSVYYYETGGENRSLSGHRGERAHWKDMLVSIESIAENFNYPWPYQLTVMQQDTVGSLSELNHPNILAYNAESLRGATYGPVSKGTNAILALADNVEGVSTEKELEFLQMMLAFSAESRQDNAAFLRRHQEKNTAFSKISQLMQQSSEQFRLAAASVAAKDLSGAAAKLRLAAQYEQEAGERLETAAANRRLSVSMNR